MTGTVEVILGGIRDSGVYSSFLGTKGIIDRESPVENIPVAGTSVPDSTTGLSATGIACSIYRNLADASVCRAQADWLVGMNASRAFTKVYDYRLSVGRVQTPTLAMLVDREDEITNFQKQQYFITHLLVESIGKTIDAVSEHFTDQEEANRLAGMCRGRTATIPSIERRTKTVAPPKLYDLTTLQRDANRLFGYTAAKTLECAQSLYENKLIT